MLLVLMIFFFSIDSPPFPTLAIFSPYPQTESLPTGYVDFIFSIHDSQMTSPSLHEFVCRIFFLTFMPQGICGVGFTSRVLLP